MGMDVLLLRMGDTQTSLPMPAPPFTPIGYAFHALPSFPTRSPVSEGRL